MAQPLDKDVTFLMQTAARSYCLANFAQVSSPTRYRARGPDRSFLLLSPCLRKYVTAQVVPQKAACGRARDRKANFSSANSPTDRLSEGVPGHHRGVPGQLRKYFMAGDIAVSSRAVCPCASSPAMA